LRDAVVNIPATVIVILCGIIHSYPNFHFDSTLIVEEGALEDEEVMER
jgi:hypothetical protein